MLVVYVALQGPAAVNKRLSNRGVLAGQCRIRILHRIRNIVISPTW